MTAGFISIRLDYWQRGMLKLIADRGGEVPFNRLKVDPDKQARVNRGLDDLLGKGCIQELPIVGAETGAATIRLTNIGRNLVDLIRQGAGVKV